MLHLRLLPGLERWVRWVALHPRLVAAVLALLTLAAGWVAVSRFAMNSDLNALIRQDASWRADYERYQAAFPDLVHTVVVVVSGSSLEQVEATARTVEARIRARTDLFSSVSAPQNDPFFRRHALLYLTPEALDEMSDRLVEAQPVLTAVAEDPSLRGVLDLVREAVTQEAGSGFDRIVRLLTGSADRLVAGADPHISWTDEFFGTDAIHYRLVALKGRSDFGVTLPDAAVMVALRELISGVQLSGDTRVELTGEVALAHEEIEAAVSGVQLAGWLSGALLLAVLVLGVRSAKIILLTVALLLVGSVWTAALAMLMVGEFNTLSIVFLVMFFGLGVDFAIHFSLRFQETVNASQRAGVSYRDSLLPGLTATTASVGGAIGLCTLTTAIGFLAFWPTAYRGLADLGVISSAGMAVAAFLTFTLLPAGFALMGPIRPHVVDLPTGDRLVRALRAHPRAVLCGTALLTIAAAWLAAGAHFDYSVLALKDPNAESVRTLKRLQAEDISNDYTLTLLSSGPVPEPSLSGLAEVERVVVPADYVPQDQPDKLLVLQDLESVLWSAMDPVEVAAPPDDAERAAALDALRAALAAALPPGAVAAAADAAPAPSTPDAAARSDSLGQADLLALAEALDRLAQLPPQALGTWEQGVLENLVDELDWLRGALLVDPVTLDDLPRSLRAQLVSPEGLQRSVILPAEDISEGTALRRFVEHVRDVAPHATGRPVIEWGVGAIVLDAFTQALLTAALAIFALLLVNFRSLRDALLILVPLVLAALFTLAMGVVLDLPLNMANIIVLPLIFGLGVDNGIHVVDRFHGAGDVDHLLHSSTPRAVVLSSVTTIGTFAALALSPHRGTASIGMLLTAAVGLLLVCTVVLLPVLLERLGRARFSSLPESAAMGSSGAAQQTQSR
ncbi:MAG: MMPL family transporter [Pseudomonadales bacterium]